MKRFNVVVVGSGTSAYSCVDVLLKAGKSVAMVDERAYGGTCALRGCQPKKYMVANAEAVAMCRHLAERGIDGKPVTNWADMQRLKAEFLDGHSDGTLRGFQKRGVETFHGKAVLAAPDALTVLANSATEQPDRALVEDVTLQADNFVIATGSTPRRNNIPGAECFGDSEAFLALPELPRRIAFIGGGYISFEFATVAAFAGARPTIIHRGAEPLKQFDRDIVGKLMEASRANGIDFVLEDEPTRADRPDSSGPVTLTLKSGKTLEVDYVVEASGRVPSLGVIGDDNRGGVEASGRGIAVNEYLQSTTNPRVYAIGDVVASGVQLAPVADEEGKVAAANILEPGSRRVDYTATPSVVFTTPNLASVGMDEAAAAKAGKKFRVNTGDPTRWPSSKRIGEKVASYKVLIEDGTDQVLGAHLLRHNAGETINIFALAMKNRIPASELAQFMWAYPTYTSDLKYMVK